MVPNYLQNFGFDNLRLDFGPNFRLEYSNIIKTYLDTNSGASRDLIINGSIKENIEKNKAKGYPTTVNNEGRGLLGTLIVFP